MKILLVVLAVGMTLFKLCQDLFFICSIVSVFKIYSLICSLVAMVILLLTCSLECSCMLHNSVKAPNGFMCISKRVCTCFDHIYIHRTCFICQVQLSCSYEIVPCVMKSGHHQGIPSSHPMSDPGMAHLPRDPQKYAWMANFCYIADHH